MKSLVALFLMTGTAFGGMTVGEARWSSKTVEVCFASKNQKKDSRFGEDSKTFPTQSGRVHVEESTAEERELIEKVVREEYRLDSTGFEFVGFRECAPGTKAKIFIYLGRGGPLAAANIGEKMKIDKFWVYRDREGRQIVSPVYVKLEASLPSYLYFQNLRALADQPTRLGVKDLFRSHALHEFGHAAGLLHEDERAEANQNPNCTYRNGQSMYRVSAPIPLTAYDPASIMSYCFLDYLSSKSGLHFQISRPGADPERLPSAGLPIVRWPGIFLEDSLRTVSRRELADRFEVEFRLGLSEKDRLSLRTLYAR